MTHRRIAYPWIAFSDMYDFFKCKRMFKYQKLDNLQRAEPFPHLVRGTALHSAFDMFFDKIDIEKVVELAEKIRVVEKPYRTELYFYFVKILKDIVNLDYLIKNDKDPASYQMNIEGFSIFQVKSICTLMLENHRISKNMLEKYFVPKGREVFLKDEDNMIYGTIDAYYLNSDESYSSIDYKTGKQSGRVSKRGKIGIPWPYNMQVWIYTRLLSLRYGKDWKGMIGGVLWTRGSSPMLGTLKITRTSKESLFSRLNKLRDHVDSGKDFPKCYEEGNENYVWYVCPWCQYQAKCFNAKMLGKLQMRRNDY